MKSAYPVKKSFVFTGWHMLAVMVLFFGTIISVNMFMAWNAVSSWSGLVVPNTYVASQQFNDKVAAARALAASGLAGDLVIADGTVTYRLSDADGLPVPADAVSAVFKRPVDERADFRLDLERMGEGSFAAAHAIPSGQWVVDITATNGDETVFHQTLRMLVRGGVR